MALSLGPQERQYFDQLFSVVDKDDAGVLPGQDALPFLMSSGLPQQTLGEVWAIADAGNNGFLTRNDWYKAARLIGWLQKGGQTKVDESLASRSGPLPTFQGQPPPPTASQAPLSAQTTGLFPAITPADRTKFTRIFVGCGPQNGQVSGDKARDVFVKSQLSYDKLGQIWNLADTQQRGSLDLPDFIIGMWLIQSCMANPSLQLPATLPPGTYEQASGGRPPPPISPIALQHTGGAASPIRAQYTGGALQTQYTGGALQPQRTGQSVGVSTPTRAPRPAAPPARWDVTSDAKATSDRFFAQLDPQNRGVIEGDVAVPFMLQSQLDDGTLASIWDLADIKHEGKLDRDQFAVAMHLINAKLAGQDVPAALPTSLVPPSLRGEYDSQEVLAGHSSATKDLFDLFDDPPAQPSQPPQQPGPAAAAFAAPPASSSAFASAFLPPAPSRKPTLPKSVSSDLLGDDAPAPVPDNSAEVGNKRNQLDNTTRAAADLEKTRTDLEVTTSSSQSQIEELESKLSAARVKHEAETKAVADLRARVSEQATQLKQLQSDVIAAESDLSAMRSEKDELEQALLHDKEEVRGLQKRMKEVDDEKTGLKLLLEKLRKDGRQQKGMVTIAKKQLSTAETSKDNVQKEVHEAEQPEVVPSPPSQAAAVPLPSTPQALSPAPTGVSQRSNNPFDRLTREPKPPSEPTSPSLGASAGAAVGVAAGAVVAGATSLYQAAKDVVAPEASEEQPREVDPFGAETAPKDEQIDPFGAPTSQDFASTFEDNAFDRAEPVASQPSAPTDFDSAFADLDEPKPDKQEQPDQVDPSPPVEISHGIPAGVPKSAIPALRPDAERSESTQAVAPSSPPAPPSQPQAEVEELVSSDEEEGPEDLEEPSRPYKGKERELDAVQSEPVPEVQPSPPRNGLAPPILSAPVEESKTRRSAPPPPISRSSGLTATDSFDPFGAPSTVPAAVPPATDMSAPSTASFDPFGAPSETPAQAPAVSAPSTARFDDDDFDFSDLPPAQVEQRSAPAAAAAPAFDDEFAGFDDEFEKPASATATAPSSENSNGLTKSYEMVSPQVTQEQSPAQQYDEWGFGHKQTSTTAQAPPSGLSFDDAFGGDFEPAPPAAEQSTQHYAPPPGLPPTAGAGAGPLSPPVLPERRLSQGQPQPDDIEDVKKLCAMGFSRELVVDALAANNYDFQKTLNVLLTQ